MTWYVFNCKLEIYTYFLQFIIFCFNGCEIPEPCSYCYHRKAHSCLRDQDQDTSSNEIFENQTEDGGYEVSDANDQGTGVGFYHIVFTLKFNLTNKVKVVHFN